MQNFQGLEVYKLSKRLVVDVIKELEDVKSYFRLKEQLISAINSICSNLGEMSAFDSPGTIKQKIQTCIGEANEAEHDIDVFHEIGIFDLVKHRDFIERIRIIRKMLINLLKKTGWKSKRYQNKS